MKSIFVKLILIFMLSAIIPVLVSYRISINKVRETNESSVANGNLGVGIAASRDAQNYFQNGLEILHNTASALEQITLNQRDRDHLLKITYANHPYFQHITLLDRQGNVMASSSFNGRKSIKLPRDTLLLNKKDHLVTDVYIADNPPPLRPALGVFIPIHTREHGDMILSAELNLIYAWHLVHRMKIGKTAEIFLLDSKGRIFASSNMSILFSLEPYPDYSRLLHNGKIVAKTFLDHTNPDTGYLTTVVPVDFPEGSSLVIRQNANEAFSLSRTVVRQILILAVFVIILMIVFGYLGVNRMILLPVKILTHGLEKIASGFWDHRIQIKSGDEFENMGEHYNKMAEKLVRQAHQIRAQERLSLIGRISGGLIHDLKHPMTNIRNWTKLMPDKISDPVFVGTFTDVVNREFTNVDRFFTNLKDLTSEMTLHLKDFAITSLFEEMQKRFELGSKNQSVRIEFNGGENLFLKADYFLITRVLSNLISNALQAVQSGGLVRVAASKQTDTTDHSILFTVSDSGTGIPPDRLKTLFDDFTTTKKRGLGLGLAIAKKIVALHGGEIQVKSQINNGTVFSFWIPETPQAPVKERAEWKISKTG